MGALLEHMKKTILILDYLKSRGNYSYKDCMNTVLVDPCPLCGHKGHFFVYPKQNTYCSFACGKRGGSIIDFISEFENCSIHAAIDKLSEIFRGTNPRKKYLKPKYDGNFDFKKNIIESYNNFICYYKIIKEIKKLYIEDTYQYKMFDFLESFYDRLSNKLINFDDKKSDINEIKHMQHILNHVDEMFCAEFNYFKKAVSLDEKHI